MKEKYTLEESKSEVKYEENKLLSFDRSTVKQTSYRFYQDGKVGYHFHMGECSDEEGYAKARENLERERPYPFEPETGKRSRDKREKVIIDKELMETAEECMQYLCEKYPRFTFSATFRQNLRADYRVNEKGMDYSDKDSSFTVGIGFKHVESKDISDGGFGFAIRSFNKEDFFRLADYILSNYEKEVELPEEIIIECPYHSMVGMLAGCLNGESLALGTSLLSGKIGEKLFSEEFTLMHDVSDKECWFTPFWDGDGCVTENDRCIFIDKGVVVTGFADKKTAQKYHIPHTGNACNYFSDIPEPGYLNLRVARSAKTTKELLAGRYCVLPISSSGGGFNEKGEFVTTVQRALLSDGEKILGKLPPFTMVSSMYDMFGKDYIGVGADNSVLHDKTMLFRVRKG